MKFLIIFLISLSAYAEDSFRDCTPADKCSVETCDAKVTDVLDGAIKAKCTKVFKYGEDVKAPVFWYYEIRMITQAQKDGKALEAGFVIRHR